MRSHVHSGGTLMRIVVAIGGNAITAEDERGTWAEQRANAAAVARDLVELRRAGHELVLTHGNGPQVGALYAQQTRVGAPGARSCRSTRWWR